MIENMHRRNWYFLINLIFGFWLLAAVISISFHRFFIYPVWLMVHTTLLGAASTAIYIWSQHFADTLTRRQAPGGRKVFALRFGGHTIGAILVIWGMVTQITTVLFVGVILLALSALAHTLIMFMQLRGALTSRFGKLVRFYALAGLWLAVGVAAGFWLATLDGADPLRARLFLAHSMINLFGWIGTTVIGTIILFLPTVLHSRMSESAGKLSNLVLSLITVGTGVVVAGAFIAQPILSAVGLLLWISGLAIVLKDAWQQVRGTGRLSFAGLSLVFAMLWLTGLLLTLTVAFGTSTDTQQVVDRVANIVPPLIAGFVAQLILGSLSYLLAVVMGSPAARKAAQTELDRGAAFRVTAINIGIAVYLLPLPSIAKVVLSLFVFAVLLVFVPLAVRAIIAAARVRKSQEHIQGSEGLLQIGKRQESQAKPSMSGQIVTAAGAIILLLSLSIAADPAAIGVSTIDPLQVSDSGKTTIIDVRVEGMRFVPAVLEVPAGDRLIVKFTNTGKDTHDITFANGVSSKRLQPGESETVDVGIIGADMAAWCSITGHRAMGMEAAVRVTGAPADEVNDKSDSEATAHDSQRLAVDLSLDPPASFKAFDARLPPPSDQKLHRVRLAVTDETVEVAPGITQTLWSYDGQVPGPVLRGNVGDEFEVTLVNEGTIGHSIDFHAGVVAPDQPMRTIAPGESLVYKFKAERAGIWMYHCSTAPMSAHIANGMFGAVIIDPPGLNQVDREYVLVQSEFYLGEQGGEVDAAKIAGQMPDLVTFNGYANQYVHEPLDALAGETIRIWLLAAGPNVSNAFHVVGGQFHTVFKEGNYLLQNGGATGVGGSQTLDLSVAQGGFVELTLPEAGNYPFVSHIMSDAEKGASGIISVK